METTTRPTEKFTTKGGHIVEMYTYMNGYERRELTRLYLANGAEERDRADKMFAEEELTVKTLVKSIDDEEVNVVEAYLQLPIVDALEIKERLSDMVDVKKNQLNKTLSSDTSTPADSVATS